MFRLACACMVLLSGGAADAASLPPDVEAFVVERESCDHFRGEEPYDAERAKEIAAALELYCRGTDARLKGLMKTYRNGPASVRDVLNGYEYPIE